MEEISYRSDVTVRLVDSMASDTRVIRAAKVSTKGSGAEDDLASLENQMKFIDFLMSGRHGSPFEHNVFTFMVTAPIFVWREFMRHRIASYNEESGRYKQLDPVFYIPDEHRLITQVGKPGAYHMVEGTVNQVIATREAHMEIARLAYRNYEALLEMGIAREVARMTLPVNIYSSAYVTINSRSLMNFLSLRTKREASAYPSYPQREIEMVAEQMEIFFEMNMPVTYRAFNHRGRVAP